MYLMLKAATESSGSEAPVPKECMWRQTALCSPNGKREPGKDVSCELAIPKGVSGFCDCDGDGYVSGTEKGFSCHEAPINCRSYCGIGVPPGGEGQKVTPQCVPKAAQDKWRADFRDAVDTMLQKTQHGMQHGLQKVAKSVMDLVDGVACGDLKTFATFKDQAERLRVLASVRRQGEIDAKVKYEPLKTLIVGDADIHSELNALIIGWQLQKGPEDVGRAITDLLNDFKEEEESEGGLEAPPENQDAPPAPPPPAMEDHHDSKDVRTVHFWAEALSTAFEKYGDPANSITSDCLTEAAAGSAGEGIEAGFNTMLEKNRRSMSRGLKLVAKDVIGIVDSLEVKCTHLKYTNLGPERLRKDANRMVVLAGAKTLVNFAEHVEYEAMKELKVGGIDVHTELNRFIMAWINNQGPRRVGEGLADFFDDFQEAKEDEGDEESEENVEENGEDERTPVMKMVFDAFEAAGGGLGSDCIAESQDLENFEIGVNTAIEHMLKKQTKTMQTGLQELASTTDAFVNALPRHCAGAAGATAIHRAARKVRNLTRRTVVDYGTHIKYEAMKSLQVGNVAVHNELNSFIRAWKLQSVDEAGRPFGELFAKLSTIEGNDEL